MMQVRKREILVVSVRITIDPVWRRYHVQGSVLGRSVDLCVARPRNAAVGHSIRLIHDPCITSGWIQPDGLENGVVEERVCDQTARIISLCSIPVKRTAIASSNRCVRYEITFELRLINGFDISTVILVEVGQAVVHVYRRANVVGNIELEGALCGIVSVLGARIAVGLVEMRSKPGRLLGRGSGRGEGGSDSVSWNGGSRRWDEGCLFEAIRVVDAELLDLEGHLSDDKRV